MENVTVVVNITNPFDFSQTPAKTATIDISYIIAASCLTIILLRTLIRRLNHERYKLDDFIMLASTPLLLVITASTALIILDGNNIDVGNPIGLSEIQIFNVILGSKFVLINRAIVLSYIWTMKLCLLIYYTRITSYTKEVWMIRGSQFVLGVTWLVCMLTFFLECNPTRMFWAVQVDVPECAKALDAILVMGLTDTVTTLMVMAHPIPVLMRVRLPSRTLGFIGFGYLVGTFVLLVPMVRMVITIGQTQEQILLWKELECFAATVAANAPIIHGLHRHAWGHIRRGKFGKDVCSAPDFTLAIDSVETQPLDADNTRQNRPGSHIRNSLRELKGRVRGTSKCGEIKATVELLQESKTGRMDPNEGCEGPGGLDIFLGSGHGRGPIGHVSTEVFSDSARTSKKNTWIRRKC